MTSRTARQPAPLILALASASLLAGCQQGAQAPDAPRVCYQVVQTAKGEVKFNVVKSDVATLEACIARLDQARYAFLRLGSPNRSMVGAYGGKFLFIDQAGVRVSTTSSIDSGQFQAFTRGPDGKLTLPGYIPQPAPDPSAAGSASQ